MSTFKIISVEENEDGTVDIISRDDSGQIYTHHNCYPTRIIRDSIIPVEDNEVFTMIPIKYTFKEKEKTDEDSMQDL